MARLPFSLFKQGAAEYEVKDSTARAVTSNIRLDNVLLKFENSAHYSDMQITGVGSNMRISFGDGSTNAPYKIALMKDNAIVWKIQ